jgi:hypothetical protein
MAEIVESIEISRRPQDVFSYVTNPAFFPEWQESVVSVRREGDAPLTVGATATVVRQVGPRKMSSTEEIAELNPPRTWAVRADGGPLVAILGGWECPHCFTGTKPDPLSRIAERDAWNLLASFLDREIQPPVKSPTLLAEDHVALVGAVLANWLAQAVWEIERLGGLPVSVRRGRRVRGRG